MSNEVKRYIVASKDAHDFDLERIGPLAHERLMVCDTDYAALEAECERWKERCQYNADTAHAVATERDALHTQLEAIRAAGGEQVEVIGFLYEDGDILGKCDMAAGTFSLMASPDFDGNVSKLMTVAQHQRTVAAMAAELEEVRRAQVEVINSRNAHQWECERLTAELEAARKQEPVAECVEFGRHANIIPTEHGKAVLAHGAKLYALPPLAGKVVVPEWVPVSERLPEPGVTVMVFAPPQPGDYPGDVRISFDGICPESDGDYWVDHGEHYENYCMIAKGGADIEWHGPSEKAPYTHWMPLPAAPALLATPSMEVSSNE